MRQVPHGIAPPQITVLIMRSGNSGEQRHPGGIGLLGLILFAGIICGVLGLSLGNDRLLRAARILFIIWGASLGAVCVIACCVVVAGG